MTKAEIISRKDGVVRIGNTYYQPATGAIYSFKGRPDKTKKRYSIIVDIKKKGMPGAKEALQIAKKYGSI